MAGGFCQPDLEALLEETAQSRGIKIIRGYGTLPSRNH